MKKKVRFTESVSVLVLTNTKDEDFWRRTKQKTIGYIKYKSKRDFDELMLNRDYRIEYYNKIDRIKRHRQRTLRRLAHTNKIRNNTLYY